MSKFISRLAVGCAITAVITLTLSIGTASSAKAVVKDCRYDYRNLYLKRPGHKAMAVTGGRSPYAKGISCGTAWNYPTISRAINEALRQCRVSDRKYKDPGICQIVKVQ